RDELRLTLANVQFQAKKFDDAAATIQGLIDKRPKGPESAQLWVQLGEVRRTAGDLKAAGDAYQKARELAPTNPAPILAAAMLYDTSGRTDEALKAYEEVLKLQPDNDVALNNLAYAKADSGTDLDQALAFAQKARQRRPNDPNVIDTLGLIYLRKNL